MLSENSCSYYESFVRSEKLTDSTKICESIGIVIVNWNSWGETLEALEAVFKMEGFLGPVVVCDNDSSDGSIEKIEQWAKGKLCALPESSAPEIRELVLPGPQRINKFRTCSALDVESSEFAIDEDIQLYIVRSEANLGFGAGSNLGLKLLVARSDVEWYWLLNCDALPRKDALTSLRSFLPRHGRPTICGTVLLEYYAPDRIQSCGARFNRTLCSMNDIFSGVNVSQLREMSDVAPVDYPVGASTLVNSSFLREVGYLREDYFLYFEELDWVMRHGWPSRAFIITGSKVYHKGGSTTGAGANYKERTLVADYYFLRSRVLFARRYALSRGVTACLVSMIALLRRAMLCDRKAFINSVRALRDGFRMPLVDKR